MPVEIAKLEKLEYHHVEALEGVEKEANAQHSGRAMLFVRDCQEFD